MSLTRPPLKSINIRQERHFAVITINRPESMNCLARETIDELEIALSQLSADNSLKVLIITGAGGIFSAGADLSEVAALTPQIALEFSRRGQAMLGSFGEVAPITMAAIEGHCLGGGLDIALSCDLRFADPRSTFQHPGARRGIVTGWGGTKRLPELIGVDSARRLLITGDKLDAAQALELGLINGIYDDPLRHAVELAQGVVEYFSRRQLVEMQRSLNTKK